MGFATERGSSLAGGRFFKSILKVFCLQFCQLTLFKSVRDIRHTQLLNKFLESGPLEALCEAVCHENCAFSVHNANGASLDLLAQPMVIDVDVTKLSFQSCNFAVNQADGLLIITLNRYPAAI